MELKRINVSDTSEVKKVFVTKLYIAFAERSAWNWTEFSYFSGVVTTTLDSVKNEGKRIQGSHWSIEETPGIAVCAKNQSLILCDINNLTPFLDWNPPPLQGNTLRSVSEAWGQSVSKHWSHFISSLSNVTTVEPADQPFIKYQSYSSGSRYSLNWSPVRATSGTRDQRVIDLQHIYKYAGLLASNIEGMLKNM